MILEELMEKKFDRLDDLTRFVKNELGLDLTASMFCFEATCLGLSNGQHFHVCYGQVDGKYVFRCIRVLKSWRGKCVLTGGRCWW